MFGLSKLWTYVICASVGALLVAGIFGAGYSFGSSRVEVRYQKSAMQVLGERVQQALDVADRFADLGNQIVKEVAETRASTSDTVTKGTQYVQAHPPVTHSVVDDYLIELRNCQIDRIYQAAGHQLPSFRHGAACPPAVPK